jgi:hypothetical protein
MEKRQTLKQMFLGKLDICLQKTETISMPVTLYTSINSKWIKDLNIRPETLKLVHKRAGNTLEAISIGLPQLTQQLKERINKWDYMK